MPNEELSSSVRHAPELNDARGGVCCIGAFCISIKQSCTTCLNLGYESLTLLNWVDRQFTVYLYSD